MTRSRVLREAPGEPEWFIIAFEDRNDPGTYAVLRRLTYAGSLRGAETQAQEVLIQCRVAKRGVSPVWIEIWNPDNIPISRYGDVPKDPPPARGLTSDAWCEDCLP